MSRHFLPLSHRSNRRLLAQAHGPPEKQQQQLQAMDTSIDRLIQLVKDTLKFDPGQRQRVGSLGTGFHT